MTTRARSWILALRGHWPEYLMEAAELGIFLFLACTFGSLLEHPASPVRHFISSAPVRRVLMGLAMGTTAIAIVYSPLGRRSGAHFNPAVTLTFLRLGKIRTVDAVAYIVAQFVGGLTGVLVAYALLGAALADHAVDFVVTVPGMRGSAVAFITETAMTFVLMSVVLRVSNRARIAHLTGVCAGALVATHIAALAPLSGMSMNPARSLASAVPAQVWTGLWIYFTAPLLGMLAAAQIYLLEKGERAVFCAKLHHAKSARCIFCESRVTSPDDPHPNKRA